MTKEEFAKRWGYQTAQGYGQALFDCREQLLNDLDEVIKNISLNLPVIKSVCVCTYSWKTYLMNNIERCNYCNQPKAEQTVL